MKQVTKTMAALAVVMYSSGALALQNPATYGFFSCSLPKVNIEDSGAAIKIDGQVNLISPCKELGGGVVGGKLEIYCSKTNNSVNMPFWANSSTYHYRNTMEKQMAISTGTLEVYGNLAGQINNGFYQALRLDGLGNSNYYLGQPLGKEFNNTNLPNLCNCVIWK